MSKTITISPVTRVHGTLEIEVVVEAGRVTNAQVRGSYFRGFEEMVKGRDPRDLSYFTSRICGICSTAHSLAATWAVENYAQLQVPVNAILLRNIMLAADLLQNHVRHFYTLGLFDWVKPPEGVTMFTPAYADYRLPKKLNDEYVAYYNESKDIARKCHELTATFGAKAPHIHGIVVGGVSVHPDTDKIKRSLGLIGQIRQFIQSRMIPVAESLAEYYPEYLQIGRGAQDLLTVGLFPDPYGKGFAFPSGVMLHEQPGQVHPMDEKVITEAVTHSWYRDQPVAHPRSEETVANRQKPDAYTWIKAPRYQGRPMEVGPAVRQMIKGTFTKNLATLQRIQGRVLEAAQVADYVTDTLGQLEPEGPIYTAYHLPQDGEGVSMTGAMRGPLGYWLRVRGGKIDRLQIITPSAWFMSPQDDQGLHGPMETALIGTPIADENSPVEIGRIVRSYDPCISCGTHVMTAHGHYDIPLVW